MLLTKWMGPKNVGVDRPGPAQTITSAQSKKKQLPRPAVDAKLTSPEKGGGPHFRNNFRDSGGGWPLAAAGPVDESPSATTHVRLGVGPAKAVFERGSLQRIGKPHRFSSDAAFRVWTLWDARHERSDTGRRAPTMRRCHDVRPALSTTGTLETSAPRWCTTSMTRRRRPNSSMSWSPRRWEQPLDPTRFPKHGTETTASFGPVARR